MSEIVENRLIQTASPGLREVLVISLLPLALIAILFILRSDAGPFWQWRALDPSYVYLFDALNILNLQLPGHLAHPGVPVYTLGAFLMRVMHPLTPSGEITSMVLANPESYLHAISALLIFVNAAALWITGYAAYLAFGGLIPAAAIQLAPFLSKLILKRGFLATPETLLISATLILITVILYAIRNGELERRRERYAFVFGLCAGFGVAIKMTAAPIFVLPLIILLKPRAIFLYGLWAAIAFLLFTLPAWGAFDVFFAFLRDIFFTAPIEISSPKSFGDPASVLKILKRPVLNVPIILSMIVVMVEVRRIGLRDMINNIELRTILGISVAQLTQAVFVAKQANAYYMIPSYMLSALSMVLALRYLAGRISMPKSLPISAKGIGMILLAGVALAQLENIHRLDRNLITMRHHALSADDGKFDACARIYGYPASSQTFALYLADHVTGSRFASRLKPLNPANDFWIDDWWDTRISVFKNWDGPADPVKTIAGYPCLYLRGDRYGRVGNFLQRFAPGRVPDRSCSTPEEEITVVGVNCRGELTN